jgi:hypothetical protein
MVVALDLTSMIVVGLGSALVLGSRAMAYTTVKAPKPVQTGDVLNWIEADLQVAIAFTEPLSATAVAFTVPDRGSDDLPDTIRYAWTGATLNPDTAYRLTRQVNGGAVSTIAENVMHFDLGYTIRTIEGVAPPPPIESGEVLLIAHDYAGGTLKEWRMPPKTHSWFSRTSWIYVPSGTNVTSTSKATSCWPYGVACFTRRWKLEWNRTASNSVPHAPSTRSRRSRP